mgnify:CR=1 FL=1
MTVFSYDPALLDRFPTIRAGVIHARGVSNGPTAASLLERYEQEQLSVVRLMEGRTPGDVPALAAWRRAFSAFGVKPTQYRNAAEALLRRLTKQGNIPSINTLVDIGNLVSIRYSLPVAFFDQAAVAGATTVRIADGSERFTDLGSRDVVNPEPGEVIFVDDAGLVSARRWCWRQSAESATGQGSTDVLVTVEGHHQEAAAAVAAALDDIGDLLAEFQPGAATERSLLGPDNPSF